MKNIFYILFNVVIMLSMCSGAVSLQIKSNFQNVLNYDYNQNTSSWENNSFEYTIPWNISDFSLTSTFNTVFNPIDNKIFHIANYQYGTTILYESKIYIVDPNNNSFEELNNTITLSGIIKGATYDTNNNKIVMFNQTFDGTEEIILFDVNTLEWEVKSTSLTSLSIGDFRGMAFDSESDKTILVFSFGVDLLTYAYDYINDVMEEKSSLNFQQGTSGNQMIYDSNNDKVLFVCNPYNDSSKFFIYSYDYNNDVWIVEADNSNDTTNPIDAGFAVQTHRYVYDGAGSFFISALEHLDNGWNLRNFSVNTNDYTYNSLNTINLTLNDYNSFSLTRYNNLGCLDSDACNYNSNTDIDDGSCDYDDFECETCENGVVLANDDDIDVICNDVDTCFGFNPSGDVDGDGICDSVDPCYGPTTLISWENTNGNGWVDAEEAVFDYIDTDADGICDSEDDYPECPGIPDCAGECNGGSYVDNCGQCMCGPNSDPDIYECDDDDECEQGCDGLWYADLDAMPIVGCDGVCDSGATSDQCGICDANPDNDDINCTGCAESTACNYDVEAIVDCLDCCLYPTGACQSCQEGSIVTNDVDNDFTCDDVDNCPDDSNEDQSDGDGDSIGDVCDSCPLDFENDADADGFCESDEIHGCTDTSACNYSSLATEENGTCEYLDGVCESCSNCFVSYSTGFYHTLGLKSDGTVEAWGGTNNSGPHNLNFGETEVPDGLTNVIAIEGGYGHSLALKSDGTVVGWGLNDAGQVNIPEDLNNVIAIQAGRNHSLALKSDGTVVGWGLNDRGQIDIPLDLDDVISISTGWHSSLALKSDGTVVGWGDDSWGLTTPPDNLSNVIEVSIASYSSNALLQDGTVVSWGAETFGGVTPDNLSNVVAIETGAFNVVALKDDGTVVVWGSSTNDINEVPSDLMNINSISFSYHHVIAQSATEVYTWGDNWQGQLNIPICGVIVDNDSDDDTVCDDVDICNGSDDYLDYDNDGLCDGVDPCIGIDTLDEECIFYGDINQDGNIDESDAIFLIGYLMGGSSELLGMDYNQDGTVDLLDCASLVYEIYDIDISSESLQNDSSDLGLALYYDSVNLMTANYVAGILLTLTTCDGCDFDFNLPSELVSTAVFTDTTAKILIMHDPRDQDSLEELLLDVVEGSYGIDVSQTQIIDVDSHLDFSLLYHMGDINMDVIINILDVIHLIDIILSVTLEDDMNPYADINQDGVVNVMDVVLLVYFIFDMS